MTKENNDNTNGYISLKLQRSLNLIELRNLLNDLIEEKDPGFIKAREGNIQVKWLDLAEILLKADGSWDKNPFLYHKYDVMKYFYRKYEKEKMGKIKEGNVNE